MSNLTPKNNLPPVLVDTPIWLSYFRKDTRIFQEVNALMDAGRVCSLSIIVAELLYTAQNKEELNIFQDFTKIFPILQEKEDTWLKAALFSGQLRRKKKQLSLRDAYVAIMAATHGAFLYTNNEIFKKICKLMGLKIYKNGGKRRASRRKKAL